VGWGTIEATDEVAGWLSALPERDLDRVTFDIDLLAELGPNAGEPLTRHLRGKLRELRSVRDRISYYIATGRRVVLRTHFTKRSRREDAEIARALRTMRSHMEGDR
jgi:hypothetical protein